MVADANYANYQDVNAPAIHFVIRSDKSANTPNKGNTSNDPSDTQSSEKTKPFFSRSSIDVGKFTQRLNSITSQVSSQRCARSIRMALQSAGANVENHPVAAADWGNTLLKIGYRKIAPEFSNPRQGDIYIIQRTGKHSYGHIAGFSGSQWVSDFKQRSHDIYRDAAVKYEYYRLAQR